MPLLSVTDLVAGYGAISALKGISFDVHEGEIVTLIGSNGAGKSTTLRALSGIIKPRSGKVSFRDRGIEKLAPHSIVSLGMSHVPEGRGIFHRMSVQENLLLGAYQRKDNLGSDLERVYTLFPRLKERLSQPGGTLSGGEQQMLAIGRALMAKPTLLLLDEPSMGLSPLLVESIFNIVVEINRQGTTV